MVAGPGAGPESGGQGGSAAQGDRGLHRVVAGERVIAVTGQLGLDLGGTAADDVVMLLVRGGTGLDEDPGEFSAVPITITG